MSQSLKNLQEVDENGVRTLILNNPEKMNALATPLLSSIADRLEAADQNSAIRCSIITGNEKVFAAGADINELEQNSGLEGLLDIRPGIWNRIRSVKKPVIAAVEGYCLGAGNELLMCADIAIAGGGAKFGQPETNLGIIPGAGGASILPAIVGRQLAMRMVLLGEFINSQQALEYGLISEIVKKGQARQRATEIAIKISQRAPLAMMQAKAAINQNFMPNRETALAIERQAFSFLLSTKDKSEGVQSFLKKISPDWKGR